MVSAEYNRESIQNLMEVKLLISVMCLAKVRIVVSSHTEPAMATPFYVEML